MQCHNSASLFLSFKKKKNLNKHKQQFSFGRSEQLKYVKVGRREEGRV